MSQPETAPGPAVAVPDAPAEALPAGFGLATATFVVVASMVGVGVLTTSGFTVQATGSNQLMVALWVVGGVVALCGALTQAELSASLPRAGGDYVFLYEAYGPAVAFLSGWVSFLIGFAAPIAVASLASASYLLAPLALEGEIERLARIGLASATILAFAAVHISGQSRTIAVQGWMTAIKLGLLILFAVAGLAAGAGNWDNLDDRPVVSGDLVVASLFSLVYIGYGYTGWNAASYLAGEVADPGRRLPRAILLGTAAVMALYIALNLVYALALPAAELKTIENVEPIAELAAARLFGPIGSRVVGFTTGILLWSTVSAYVLTGPRVIYAMARSGQFPAIAGRLSPRWQTPALATALQVGWALALLWTGTFRGVVVYASVGLSLFSMLAIAAVFVLRVRQPELARPFRVPGYPWVPLGYLLPTLALTLAAFYQEPYNSSYALATILAGLPVYHVWTRARRAWAGRRSRVA